MRRTAFSLAPEMPPKCYNLPVALPLSRAVRPHQNRHCMSNAKSPALEERPRLIWWNALGGTIFALAALIFAPLVGLEVSPLFNNDEGLVTWLTLFAGVFIVGLFFWWLLLARPQRFTRTRGAVTGILTAFFSYPVVLTLAKFLQRSGPGPSAETLAGRFESVLLTTGLTLLTSGFAAVLILGIVGWLAVWLLVRLHPQFAAMVPQEEKKERGPWMRWTLRIATALAIIIVVALVGGFAWLSLSPLNTAGLAPTTSTSAPSETYADAIAAFEAIQAEEATLPLNPRCLTQLLTHGQKVERVVIYFHGLTSCPAQADDMAQKFYDLGYNVLLPRMYGHGEADVLTYSLADLTAESLVDLANESVDMAQGLGDEVVVTGLSAGGTIASWISQYRADVDNAISISPFFGPHVVPTWAQHAATNLLLLLPNQMVWWNPLETERPPELSYSYARYASHALGEVMRLGRIVNTSAQTTPPAAQNLAMLLNEADVAVSNAVAEQIIAAWQRNGADVAVEWLPFSRRLPHDLIDPRMAGGDVDMVYALLLEMMNR